MPSPPVSHVANGSLFAMASSRQRLKGNGGTVAHLLSMLRPLSNSSRSESVLLLYHHSSRRVPLPQTCAQSSRK